MAIRVWVGDLDPILRSRIKDAGLGMADRSARLTVRRRRACKAQLLNGHLAFVHELQFDAALLGICTRQGDRAWNLALHIVSRHDCEENQCQRLPHATEDITKRSLNPVCGQKLCGLSEGSDFLFETEDLTPQHLTR